MSYGSIWVDVEGLELLPIEREIIRHSNTGGVLLFTRNYANRQQLINLTQDIRASAGRDILIGVDHEGGRIWRFGDDFSRPLSGQEYGQMYAEQPEYALAELYNAGRTVARELIECGLDFTFAPVLDLDHGVSEVIGDRAYSGRAEIVIACANAFIAGLRSQGMACIGKHFPGHGGCSMDSHFATTIDQRSKDEIFAQDIQPFAQLAPVLNAVMPAHVIYPAVDNQPAGFSKIWLQQILREELGFEGAIISDCLSMHGAGVLDNFVHGINQALQAGCDMVILTQQTRALLLQTLDQVDIKLNTTQLKRIASLSCKALQVEVV